MFIKDYISDVFNATRSLLKGMRRTGYYFTHRKEIITEQYPDGRRFERRLVLEKQSEAGRKERKDQ